MQLIGHILQHNSHACMSFGLSILFNIFSKQVVIICGETGCGKTTQVFALSLLCSVRCTTTFIENLSAILNNAFAVIFFDWCTLYI